MRFISEVVRGGARGAMAPPIILPRPAMKVVEVVNNLWIPPVWPFRFFRGPKYPEIQRFLSEKLKKFQGKKPCPEIFFWLLQSQNPTYLPVNNNNNIFKKNLRHGFYLQGIISVVLFNFIVQDPNGIIEWTKETSLFSSFFIYRTISASEWWILKTGWVIKAEVLSKGLFTIVPSKVIGVTSSAIWLRL